VAIFEIDEARGYDPTRSTAGGFQLLPSPTPRTKPQISRSTYQQPRFGNRRFVRKFLRFAAFVRYSDRVLRG
jgi:hypothetical protein